MRYAGVRIGGWLIFLAVIVSTGVDIWNATRMAEPHKLVSWEHALMFSFALFGLSLTSEAVSDRLIRFIQALRGVKPRTDEHPTKLKLRRRKV